MPLSGIPSSHVYAAHAREERFQATYALDATISRRHLSKGQRAMIAAKACSVSEQSLRATAAMTGLSLTRVANAAIVLDYAPELVDAVIAGAPLDKA